MSWLLLNFPVPRKRRELNSRPASPFQNILCFPFYVNFKTAAKIIFFIYPTLRCIGGLPPLLPSGINFAISISPTQRLYYITSSDTYQFFEKSYICSSLQYRSALVVARMRNICFILLLTRLPLGRYPSGLWRKSYDRHWRLMNDHNDRGYHL